MRIHTVVLWAVTTCSRYMECAAAIIMVEHSYIDDGGIVSWKKNLVPKYQVARHYGL